MPKVKASPPPTTAANLSPLELHALMIAGKAAAKVRDNLAVGADQAVDITIRLTGPVNVGADQSQPTTTEPKAADVLALLLNALPDVARQAAVRKVAKLYGPFTKGEPAPDISGSTKLLAAQLLADYAQPSTRECRGNVTGTIQVEVLKRGGRAAA